MVQPRFPASSPRFDDEATGSEQQGQALVCRAGELAPSRGIDAATLDAQKAEGEKLAAGVAGSPAGDKMGASCLGVYRTT